MAAKAAAERESTTVTATSFLETDLEEGEWGTMRDEMLAGKEANGEAGGGNGGDGVVGKKGRSAVGGGGGREGGGCGDDGGVESSGNKGWWRIRRLGINVGVLRDEHRRRRRRRKCRKREMVVGMADFAGVILYQLTHTGTHIHSLSYSINSICVCC